MPLFQLRREIEFINMQFGNVHKHYTHSPPLLYPVKLFSHGSYLYA